MMKNPHNPILSKLLILAASLTALQAETIYSDAVEDNGSWTTIFGGFYATGNGLKPTAGSNYLAAMSDSPAQRGFYDVALGTNKVAAGTYVVTFKIGITGKFAYAGRITPIIGLTGNLSSSPDMNKDDGARLLDKLDSKYVTLIATTTEPKAVGFETWTLTYTVKAGASVIGQDLGFWAKFYAGDTPAAAKGYAFDNFTVDFKPAS